MLKRILLIVAALLSAHCSTTEGSCIDTGAGTAKRGLCAARPLSDSDYCGDSGKDCRTLDDLSTDCIGSYTEQVCDSCQGGFVRVGGDDKAERYYDGKGELAAVKRIDMSEPDCKAWFGLDLSDCVGVEDPKTIGCRQ